jgi:hypothetical protein
MNRSHKIAMWVLLLVVTGGCAHLPLKRNVVKQSNSLSDIYEQQVLNGIARFVAEPSSTPSFALPNGGGTTVSQSGTASGTMGFNARTFTGATPGLTGVQNLAENWTLKPINDPVRLRLMKCVYQYVTSQDRENGCVDCVKDLQLFFGENFAECELPACFYRITVNKPSKKNCGVKCGEYCGTHIVVDSNHFESLSRITLAILDIATVSDDQLAKRMSYPKTKTVDIDTTFLANIDGRPQLIHGKYSMPFDNFEKLQKSAIPFLGKDENTRVTADSMLQSLRGSSPLSFKDLQASPVQQEMPSISNSRSDVEAGIQSLLQMNQVLSPR